MVFSTAVAPPSIPAITSTQPPHLSRPPHSTPPQPLLASLPTLLLLIKTALTARAAAGDLFLSLAASSASPLDLRAVLNAVPTPTSRPTVLPPSFYAAAYAAALNPTHTPFDTHAPLPALHSLVDRLAVLRDLSPALFVTALLYIDRLHRAAPHLFPTSANIHALFAVAFFLAAKFHEDDFYSPSFYARLFNLPVPQLVSLESTFLHLITFRLFVTPEQYLRAEQALIAQALDSPQAISVLKSLRDAHVSSVDAAFPILRSWLVLQAGPPATDGTVRWTPSPDRTPFPKDPPPHTPPPAPPAALAALAAEQLRHDFPAAAAAVIVVDTPSSTSMENGSTPVSTGIPSQTWVSQAAEHFSDVGRARLFLLGQLANAANYAPALAAVHAVLPPLERRVEKNAPGCSVLPWAAPPRDTWPQVEWTELGVAIAATDDEVDNLVCEKDWTEEGANRTERAIPLYFNKGIWTAP